MKKIFAIKYYKNTWTFIRATKSKGNNKFELLIFFVNEIQVFSLHFKTVGFYFSSLVDHKIIIILLTHTKHEQKIITK